MDLQLIWFGLIGLLWAGYLVLEGFDFGVGALLPVLGKGRDAADTEKRRRVMLTTIGPHWDGNEVWLLTAGGATFAAFPEWYATMFSGFYLAFLVLLVALIVRNMGFEYRGKRNNDAWRQRWDWAIIGGSIVAPLLVGVALTNVVRGLPINRDMEYVGNFFTLLNPMSLLGGLVILGLSLTHGAFFLALKTKGDIQRDAQALGTTPGPRHGGAGRRAAPLARLHPGHRVVVDHHRRRGGRAPRGDLREHPGEGGLGVHRHGRHHGRGGGDVLPDALPERHADHAPGWHLAHHRERLEQRADPEDHDRRGAGLHPDRAALHRVHLLGLPQAARDEEHPGRGPGALTDPADTPMRPFDPRLLRTAPAARRPVVVLAVVGVLQGVATIGLAIALAALVVAVVEGTSLRTPGLWLAGLFVVRALLAWTSERVAAWAGVEVTAALRWRLVERWLAAPAERRPAPDRAVTLAAQGAASVEPYAARFLPALVAGAVVPVLALTTLFWVDWISGLIVLLTLPLLPFFAALIGRATQAETQKRWSALASLSGHFLDVMRGLPTLVGYGRAERQVEVIGEVSQQHRVATMSTLRIAFMSSAALELLASISVAIVAVSVGLRLTHGSMTLQAGLLAILLAPETYWPIRRVGAEFHAAADGAEAIDGILAELDVEAPATVDVGEEVGVLLSHVAYTYPEATSPVLVGVHLDAGPGLTAVTGPSGVGKSTLLELAAGLRTPTAGTVRAGRAHLVTQRPFLPAGTLRDALVLGNGAGDQAVWDALRLVGLEGFVAGLPLALATPLGDDGFGLSAGQRARIALARATLSTAPVLLVDEPTAHLDADAADLVHRVLADLGERHTVVVVTHRPELVALADRHVVLTRDGAEVVG